MSNIWHIQKGSHGGGTLVKDNGSNAGAGFFEIQVTPISETEVTADKTYEEIRAALQDGLYPIVNMIGMAKVPFTFVNPDRQFCFSAVFIESAYDSGNSTGGCMWFICDSENVWFYGSKELWEAGK
jgi:hypothetical protein